MYFDRFAFPWPWSEICIAEELSWRTFTVTSGSIDECCQLQTGWTKAELVLLSGLDDLEARWLTANRMSGRDRIARYAAAINWDLKVVLFDGSELGPDFGCCRKLDAHGLFADFSAGMEYRRRISAMYPSCEIVTLELSGAKSKLLIGVSSDQEVVDVYEDVAGGPIR